jgi:thioredoxin 1
MLNDANYKENLKGLQVLEVSGEGCANCITLMPMLYNVVSNRTDVTLEHFELDENSKNFANEYNIDRVPTVLLLDNGKEIARVCGFQPEEVFEVWLEYKIEEYKNNK